MKVVLFCGGLGMRIRADNQSAPKPMTTVGDRPILWHIMRWYAHHGAGDRVLPADIARQAGELRDQHYLRLSTDQKQVHSEQRLAAKLAARARGEETWTVNVPIPSVVLPEHPDQARLSDEQVTEWERLKIAKQELNDLELT